MGRLGLVGVRETRMVSGMSAGQHGIRPRPPAMTTITSTYEGDLHCRSVHGPSGAELPTDAPLDNQGRGEAFSPTDLVATALSTCILTILGITAERDGIGDPLDVGPVDPIRNLQPRPQHVRSTACAIAGEPIGA